MRNPYMGPMTLMGVLSLVQIPSPGQAPAARAPAPPLPRTADGRPNLQGVWQVLNTAAWDIQDHRAHRARTGVPAGQGVVEGDEIPYQPPG